MAQVVQSINSLMNEPTEMKSMDANRYATKKTIAQGMLDIALLTANASQLKYILQLLVGILFVVIGSLNINRKRDQKTAIILNDIILVAIFVISIINVITSGFGIEYSSQPLRLLDQPK